MAVQQHSAPRAFPKALPGARSAVFPTTRATMVTMPCDIPRYGLSEGDRLLFVPVDGMECDGLHLTHDGEIVAVHLAETARSLRMVWPDGMTETLPTRQVANQLAARLKRRVSAETVEDRMIWKAV